VLTVAFSPDGTRLASGSMDTTVRIWDATNGDELLALRGSAGWVRSVAFSPDGKRLAAASSDQAVHIWDAYTGEELIRLRGHGAGVRCVAFSPDGTRLASGSRDWTIRLWDTLPYRVRHRERQAILDARPGAERIVDALWLELNNPKLVAKRVREDTSLSEPVRRAALNLVLRRATDNPEP
jgi:WD40 repeat protein